jgi:hypothetical protein
MGSVGPMPGIQGLITVQVIERTMYFESGHPERTIAAVLADEKGIFSVTGKSCQLRE